MRKLRHVINKLFQHGFCVLEYSKLKMYTFYALLKDAFKDTARMRYTDTDFSFYSSSSKTSPTKVRAVLLCGMRSILAMCPITI